jgi:hypothetical protein
MSRGIHRRTTELAFPLAVHYYRLHLPADYQHEFDTSMPGPRDCWVLVATESSLFWNYSLSSGCGSALRRIFFRLFFFADIIYWDVLKIRPVVLFTPSLVAELSSSVPRRLFFCCD